MKPLVQTVISDHRIPVTLGRAQNQVLPPWEGGPGTITWAGVSDPEVAQRLPVTIPKALE